MALCRSRTRTPAARSRERPSEALSVAERVAAYEQLAAFGVSASQIAKGMATSRPAVESALTVARSKLARGPRRQLPPALLADQIGLSVGAAAKWSEATGATRGTYVGLPAR